MNPRSSIALAAFIVLMPLTNSAWSKSMCKDGTTSNVTGKGACSHHGGVADTTAAPAAAAPATEQPNTMNSKADKAPTTSAGSPTAKCKDGSLSYSKHHSGTCSHHGGVASWM